MTKYVHWIDPEKDEIIEEATMPPVWDAMVEFLGGQPESVTVLYKGRRTLMFVHEMGRVIGLERNPAATEIYFAASRARGADPMAEFEKRGTTDMRREDVDDGPFKGAEIINMDPTPNEPPGIHGPAILLEGFKY